MHQERQDGTAAGNSTGLQAPPMRVLSELIVAAASRHGDKLLFACGTANWTYTELPDIAARMAGSLHAAGIRAGDRVAILSGNTPEFMQVFLGCAWLGAIAVPINAASRGDQLRHILTNSGARLIAIETSLASALVDLGSDLPLDRIWWIGDAAEVRLAGIEATAFPAVGEPAARHPARPGDTLAILYTSGTTGLSKGVCCSNAHLFWWGENSADLLEVKGEDVLLTALPLFHVNALNSFYQALLRGATLIVEQRFSASAFWETAVRHKATVTFLLGAMVPILLARAQSPFERSHSLRVALGPAVPEAFHTAFRERFGFGLVDGYGSTETNFVIGDRADQRMAGFMGRLRPGFQAQIIDEDDNPLPDGVAGELVLRAEQPYAFSSGYFGMPEKTVDAWRNLWFHTGDRVLRDPSGLYRFVDRLKDVIRRRGENISAFEVEQVLARHPDVADVAVYPVPSDLAEDEVMAAIVPAVDRQPSPVELLDFCKDKLSYFALPRYIAFVDTLPRTENGKTQKFKLTQRGVTAETWDREAAGYKVK
jgi:crotonobetaine/carnitine-CoA ligase